MNKPIWKEKMTESEVEDLYEYELENGIICGIDTPHYDSFNEFLDMAREQVENIEDENEEED